jgi:hypothetical protein
MMNYTLILLLFGLPLAGQDRPGPPWRLDVEQARAEALREARPCVLLLNIDRPDI